MEELTLGALYKYVQSLDFLDIGIQAAQDTADQFVQRNKDQLYHGQNAKGGILVPYRSEEYARQKHGMNPLPGYGYADYKLTGAFYNNFKIEESGGVVHVYSTDPKAKKLEEREGGDGPDRIYGLNDEYMDYYIQQDFQPVFLEQIHRELKLI